jgi:hypothetical protein
MDHGRVRYQKRKCRCRICKTANAAYIRMYRSQLRSDERQETVSVDETDNQAYRDETIPAQITTELKTRDTVTYTDDGSEGWTPEELADYLESREDVECVIQGNQLHVSRPLEQEIVTWSVPEIPVLQPRKTIANGPAMPRIVPLGSAPTVPISANRAVNSTIPQVNRQEPWGL